MKSIRETFYAFLGMRTAMVLFAVVAPMNIALAETKVENKEKESVDCVPVGNWIVPGAGKITEAEVIAKAARRSAVLLGEMHDNAEHHRWQLQTLAALHVARPDFGPTHGCVAVARADLEALLAHAHPGDAVEIA